MRTRSPAWYAPDRTGRAVGLIDEAEVTYWGLCRDRRARLTTARQKD
jgi:hypothetical protein